MGTSGGVRAIKLVCTDCDGTLLNSDNTLSEANKKAIKDATDAGISVAITTGKSATGTWLDDLRDHLPSNVPSVFLQGALLCDGDGNVIDQEAVDADAVERVIKFGEQHGLTVAAYCGNEIVAAQQNEHTKLIPSIQEMEPRAVGDLRKHLLGDEGRIVNKISFLSDKDTIESVKPKAQEALNDSLTLMIPLDGLLECVPKNATKGHGAEKLLKHMGVDAKQMLALGDGNNDINLLKLAGVGVAMGNASDKLKEVATWVAPSNDDGGFAEAIKKMLNGDFDKC